MRTSIRACCAVVLAAIVLSIASTRSDSGGASRSVAGTAESPPAIARPSRAPVAAVPTPPGAAAGLEELLGPLANAGGDHALEDHMSDAYFALVERIRAEPAILDAIEDALADADRDSPEARVMLGALIGAATPESQAVLLRLLDGRRDDRELLEVMIPSMGFIAKPTTELETALRTLAIEDERPELRVQANLSMGVLAAHVHTTDPARADRIVDDYARRLTAATDPADARAQLAVLGNAATPRAAQAVEPYLRDQRPEVRAKAIEALRRTPGSEPALLEALRGDDDARVRASAAWALSHRQPSPELVRAQADQLRRERDESVATRLLDNLWSSRDREHSAVVAAVQETSRAHALETIRQRATTLLAELERT